MCAQLFLLATLTLGGESEILSGKVQFVDYNPDFTVQVVAHNEHLRVKWVEHSPDMPGEWQAVTYAADHRIKIVTYNGDIKVRLVEHNPGWTKKP
jgi:hypothetical protein